MQHFADGALVVVEAATDRKDVEVCRVKVFVKLGAIPIIMGIFRILDNPQNLLMARNSTAILQRTGAFIGEDLYADVAEADVFVFIPADRSGKSPRYTPRPLGSVHQRSHERGDDFIRVDVIHNVKEVYRRLPKYIFRSMFVHFSRFYSYLCCSNNEYAIFTFEMMSTINDEKFQLPVIFELCHMYLSFIIFKF